MSAVARVQDSTGYRRRRTPPGRTCGDIPPAELENARYRQKPGLAEAQPAHQGLRTHQIDPPARLATAGASPDSASGIANRVVADECQAISAEIGAAAQNSQIGTQARGRPPSSPPHKNRRSGAGNVRCWAVDTATVPADVGKTVATVNIAMFDATGVESDGGVRILGGRALS
jgi:hypothetical protein